MKGRDFTSDKYRFGFNGMEKDDEVKGTGNSYDFGARILDTRVGRWLSIDQKFYDYPSLSSYQYITNSPIMFIDPNGEKIVIPLTTRIFHREVYKAYMIFLKSNEGKETFRDVATARQAKKLWGDKEGAGVLAKSIDVTLKASSFIEDRREGESPGGLTTSEMKIKGYEKRQIVSLSENQLRSIEGKEKIKITVYLPIYGEFVEKVEGAAHESAVHVKGLLKFAKNIYLGLRGDDLVKEYNKGYTDIEYQHGIFAMGLNKVFENFIEKFSQTLKEKEKEKLNKAIREDKEVLRDDVEMLKERIEKKEISPKDF